MDVPIKPIDPKRTAVLLIEFQKEWIENDGKINRLMEDRPQFDAAIEGGRALLALAREAGLTVIHSGLRFADGHPELGEKGLGLRGAIKKFGTFSIDGKGSQWGAGFEPQAGEFVPAGRLGGSAFAGSNLGYILHNNRIDTLIIGGFALHVCVESTLRHGHDLGYDCYVVPEATAAFTSEQRVHVLDHVVHHYGVTLPLDTLRAQLGK
jgi:nicotinamidase-related amidase